MEFGIKISSLEELQNLKYLDKYNLIYFGNEFCERKIPTFSETKEIFEFCIKKNKTFVLLTPLLTNLGINNLKHLIKDISEINKKFEVTINDLGLLEILEAFPEVKINYGRVLIRMKKGPEIMTGCLKESPDNFKDNSLSNPELLDFLKDLNIKRFETDVPPQGIDLPENSNITLYLGNSVISVTRRCIYPKCNTSEYNYKIEPCKKECLNQIITKETKYFDRPVFIIGNAELIKTEMIIPEELKNKFNRIVIFPNIKNNL
ncbi:hypothetical protein KAI32_00145 [Candidatus Pacearchaeota archaeon]|nr:hypothetical protein [Candidatus Pacearchaeota archaeon]